MSNPYVQPTGTSNDSSTAGTSMPFGSQVATIPTTGGVAYIADSINIKKPQTVITGKDQFSRPFREVMIGDVITGDLELQLADVTTVAPTAGMPFTLVDIGGASLNLKVQDVSPKFTSSGETKVSVSFRQRFGA